MNVSWLISAKVPVGNEDKKKGFIPRSGKNGGPVFTQTVVKVFTPK